MLVDFLDIHGHILVLLYLQRCAFQLPCCLNTQSSWAVNRSFGIMAIHPIVSHWGRRDYSKKPPFLRLRSAKWFIVMVVFCMTFSVSMLCSLPLAWGVGGWCCVYSVEDIFLYGLVSFTCFSFPMVIYCLQLVRRWCRWFLVRFNRESGSQAMKV